jgi:mono/diheme cytochrome c family protein
MRFTRRVLAMITMCVWCGLVAAQENGWEVPEEFRALTNPVSPSAEATEIGQRLYMKNCQRCHGDTGMGDGPATKFIRPAPAAISTTEAQERMTDGEIFYKISEGKKPMPGMKGTLSDTERWQIVHFVRTLRQP